MNSAGQLWLCALLVILFGALVILRKRFPHVSKTLEAAALVTAAVVFLSACSLVNAFSPQ